MIEFSLEFLSTPDCDPPDSADKGVELALRTPENDDDLWVPLVYYHQSFDRRADIKIGTFSPGERDGEESLRLRGYDIPARQISVNNIKREELEICGPAYLQGSEIQFRWLQTSQHPKTNEAPVDVWRLDDVVIEFVDTAASRETLLVNDTFNCRGSFG